MRVTTFDSVVVYALGLVAICLSYVALADLAAIGGLGTIAAYAWPLIVDGPILVATRAVVTFGDHPSRRYAWSMLGAYAAVSIAANALHGMLTTAPADPTVIAVLVGVAPPISALAVTHLAVVRARVLADARRDATLDATVLEVGDAPDATAATLAARVRDALRRWTRRDAPVLDDATHDATDDAAYMDPDATRTAPYSSALDASAFLGPDGRDVWDAGIDAAQERDATHASPQVDEGDAPDATPATRPRLHAVAPVTDAPDAPPTRDATPDGEDRDALARRVAELAAEGMSNYKIAEQIGKSDATVRRLKKANRVAL